MADDTETRAGLLSGIFAVMMVIALWIMALTALEPPPQSAGRSVGAPTAERLTSR